MIVIICGPPAAGKTTLATRLYCRLADRGFEVALLGSDEFERRTYDRLYERVACISERGDTRSERGDTDLLWLLAGTFYRRAWRNRFYRLDDTCEVWVKASLETCLERNRRRAEPIPEQGVGDIYGRFEPPRADLEIDTETLTVDEAVDRLERAVLSWLDD